jgi:hypothetical protein
MTASPACGSVSTRDSFGFMRRLAEIEAAVETLPREEQGALLRNLAKRLIDPSCYDLARDLFEKPKKLGASGKRDLSTNKAYLAAFGRPPGKRPR